MQETWRLAGAKLVRRLELQWKQVIHALQPICNLALSDRFAAAGNRLAAVDGLCPGKGRIALCFPPATRVMSQQCTAFQTYSAMSPCRHIFFYLSVPHTTTRVQTHTHTRRQLSTPRSRADPRPRCGVPCHWPGQWRCPPPNSELNSLIRPDSIGITAQHSQLAKPLPPAARSRYRRRGGGPCCVSPQRPCSLPDSSQQRLPHTPHTWQLVPCACAAPAVCDAKVDSGTAPPAETAVALTPAPQWAACAV